MKTQVTRQFSLMVKQLKLSRDGAGDGAAAVRAEPRRAASSDLAQAAANPGLLERITTNPGLFEFRASSDARTSSEAYDASSEDRASLSNRSGEAAADAAANAASNGFDAAQYSVASGRAEDHIATLEQRPHLPSRKGPDGGQGASRSRFLPRGAARRHQQATGPLC